MSTRDRKTVLLLHVTKAVSHHDWMIEDGDALWTARVGPPTSAWAESGRLELTELPPHRRAYLTRQGEVSGGRGTVRRVDEGRVWVELWTPVRAVLRVRMSGFAGRVEWRRVGPDRLLARAAAEPGVSLVPGGFDG